MCNNIDDLFYQVCAEEQKKLSSQKLVEAMPKLKRGDCFEPIATYIMQFPKRFYDFWVLQPNFDYCEIFNNGVRSFTHKKIRISSPWDINNSRRFPVRDYSWLLDVLLGTEKKVSLFQTTEKVEGDAQSVYTLLDRIIADGDIKFNELWRVWVDLDSYVFTRYDITNWFSFLKSQIPVRLVDEDEMPKVNLPRVEGRRDDDYKKTMEILGCYKSDIKEILMCLKRIKECAEQEHIEYEHLFVIVYLHELAHAALDSSIDVEEGELNGDKHYSINFNGYNEVNTQISASAFAMEESLANMIMLKYLDWYSEVEPECDKLFENAEKFVKSQIDEYKFGLEQFKADVDWTKWRKYKSEDHDKHEKLEEWYQNCYGKENYTKEMFDKVFE